MANVIGLSQYHENNLRQLAAYLLSGELKADFTMAIFTIKAFSLYGEVDCGSAGCAVGHGPYAGIEKRLGEGWLGYSLRVFGAAWYEGHTRFYEWAFDSGWVSADNTPIGAAKRIIWGLDKGIPDNYRGMMYFSAPLCYL